jgi:superfamily II DNA/RNA helicase
MEDNKRRFKQYNYNEDLNIYNNFDNLNLKKELLKGIYAYGFEYPSDIQKISIKPIIDKRNIIAQSQSGTGKTACFGIGLIQNIDLSIKKTQCIILTPTRELAKQIYNVLESLTKFLPELNIDLVIGGNVGNYNTKINKFNHMKKEDNIINHILVATPGRLYDCIQKNKIDIKYIKTFVLDEADEMLSFGFYEQVSNILDFLNKKTQILLFSATIPPEMLKLIKSCNLLNNPVEILVNEVNVTLDGIKQFYVAVSDQYKYETLLELYNCININQAIIYSNNKRKVEDITKQLINDNFAANYISGDMKQIERNAVMEEFRSGGIRVLVTTDLLARGIDIQQISLVVNYDIPNDIESYIHRIGRSGRFGRKGVSINFLDPTKSYEKKIMRDIEDIYKCTIEELPLDFQKYF